MTDERFIEIKDWIDGPLWRALSRDAAKELAAEIDRLRAENAEHVGYWRRLLPSETYTTANRAFQQVECVLEDLQIEAQAERKRAEFWKGEAEKRVDALDIVAPDSSRVRCQNQCDWRGSMEQLVPRGDEDDPCCPKCGGADAIVSDWVDCDDLACLMTMPEEPKP